MSAKSETYVFNVHSYSEMNNNGNGAVRDDKMESWNSDEVCEWLRARLSADASEDLFDKEKIGELVTFIEHSSQESLIDVIKKLKACEPLETISLNKESGMNIFVCIMLTIYITRI